MLIFFQPGPTHKTINVWIRLGSNAPIEQYLFGVRVIILLDQTLSLQNLWFYEILVLKVNIVIQITYGVHEQARHLHPCPIVCHDSTNELINSEFQTSVNE
jgi:hypothetical protein